MLLPTLKKLIVLLAAVAAGVGVSPARAQVFDMQKDHVPMMKLDGLWRFHTGDDSDGKLGWASPTFEDSQWALLRSDEDWSQQGYKNYSGMAWYRFKVVMPDTHGPLALYFPELETSYEVYANGQRIGAYGGMPPHAKVLVGMRQIFDLPASMTSAGQPVTIAIRVWEWPGYVLYNGGGPHGVARIGAASLMRDWQARVVNEVYWQESATNILMLIHLIAFPAGLALFWLRRSDREYLWFGLWELNYLIVDLLTDYGDFHTYRLHVVDLPNLVLQFAGILLFLNFICSLLRQKRDLVYWLAATPAIVALVLLPPSMLWWLSLSRLFGLVGLILIPFIVCVMILLYRGAQRGVPDARLLLYPVALSYGRALLTIALSMALTAGVPNAVIDRYFKWNRLLATWPFPFSLGDVADVLLQLSILAILVMRFARSRADEEKLNAELESARAVQSILVPDEVPTVAGFAIESVYRPAGQVGGDFFQILPLGDGRMLVVIGDVSGKGMPAAMMVSLLVGTVRTLAEYTQSPGEILTGMNQRVLGRSGGGFTTCLILRVDAEGAVTAANAGHLAPYLDGEEVVVENGLPLGLDGGSVYPERRFELMAGTQLTLVTDGVVEASNRESELFGFERTAAMSTRSAEEIAEAAQAFGQDDDITVITLMRTAKEQLLTL